MILTKKTQANQKKTRVINNRKYIGTAILRLWAGLLLWNFALGVALCTSTFGGGVTLGCASWRAPLGARSCRGPESWQFLDVQVGA